MLKKISILIAALLTLAFLYLLFFPVGQQPDSSFDTSIDQPAYPKASKTVLFDEAHYNAHKATGSYSPFTKLLKNDGYEIRTNRDPIRSETLRNVDVLVIVNAAGGSNPKFLGINLVPLRKGKRDAAAFTAEEIRIMHDWVQQGGSLLLVADHYPFGSAVASLAEAFQVKMHCGFVEVAGQYPDQNDPSSIQFSRDNGLLADHPITNGRSRKEKIHLLQSFTGQAMETSAGVSILKLPPDAVEYVPPPPNFKEQPVGTGSQAFAIESGKGRVVVLGEAAMITAQIDRGQRFGMNVEGIDNRQFALNVMHWLSRLI